MRALQLRPGQDWPNLVDLGMPTPRVGEVLLRVRAAGICRTDIHMIRNYRQQRELPLILRHEIVGEVVSPGPKDGALQPGELVLAHHKLVCGKCPPCTRGRETLCLNAQVLGIDRDGGFAEYVVTEASRVIPLPASVTPAAGAALTCGGVTAYHALRTVAHLMPLETVLVLGTGGVGLFAVQIAKLLGAEVVAADLRVPALQRATALGADRILQVDPTAPGQSADQLGSDSVDVVLDLVGDPVMASSLTTTLRAGGRYVVTSGRQEDRLSLAPFPLFRRELGLLGSRGSVFSELKEVAEIAARGALDSSIAAQGSLEEGGDLLRRVENGEVVGRAVLIP
ncbi:MAG: alcohol dehydrogenase catalytic domain-containing protein [Thermoplasmata archaeon]